MKTESLIEAMDSVGTRNIYSAYKSAFLGKGKPKDCPDKFWESIKIWDNFSDVNNNDKSIFELDKETADHQIKENQSGMKQKYLQDALKLAKDNDKLIGGSKEAKKDVEIMKQRIKDSQTGKDMDYLKAKKDLAAKYEEDYNKQSTENMSEKDKRKNMEISQKDFNKLMTAMNKINKHFAEDEEEKVEDEVVENENEVSEDEAEDAEVTTEEEVDADADEDTETIELPSDVADAIRAALDEADEDEDDDEEVVEEDEEVAEDEEENNEEVEDEEESESETEQFSEKFYKFSEAITETIENLDKKADKLADEIQDNAEDKVIEFSKKDFIKFAESITNTIEGLAERINAIEIPPKNEVTKDLSNLEDTADDYEEEFVTKSDEETPETPVVAESEEVINTPECGINKPKCGINEPKCGDGKCDNFSDRYQKVKNFLTKF